MAQNAKIVTLKDPDGTPIAPRTDAKAITYGAATLDNTLETLEISKQDKFNEAQEKESVDDADLFPIADSSASSETKKVKFSNIKAKIKAYTDTLYNKTTIKNNLTTESEGSALDAAQGKILDDKITMCNTQIVAVKYFDFDILACQKGYDYSAAKTTANGLTVWTEEIRLRNGNVLSASRISSKEADGSWTVRTVCTEQEIDTTIIYSKDDSGNWKGTAN